MMLNFMRSLKKNLQKFFNAKKERIQLIFTTGYIEAKSELFYNLISQKAKIKRLATGFQFTEGPIWFAAENYLLFSDIPASKIYKLSSGNKVSVFREFSNNSNGLTRDKEGRLIACEHGTRRLTRTEKDGSITILADQFQEKKLNSPNDVIVKNDGSIYFTDPPFGIKIEQQKQPYQGVYCISPDGKLILVADDFERPNGLAFSPDEKKLYIDDSFRHHLRVFDVQDNGILTNGKIFYDMKINKPGCPDGMKVDIQGNIYCTGAGGIWVFNPEGNHLGTIVTPEIPANCAWGDADLQTLYITAQTSIYTIRVNIPGIKVRL